MRKGELEEQRPASRCFANPIREEGRVTCETDLGLEVNSFIQTKK